MNSTFWCVVLDGGKEWRLFAPHLVLVRFRYSFCDTSLQDGFLSIRIGIVKDGLFCYSSARWIIALYTHYR